jgi:uncharacterized OB-fold protein
MTQAARWPHRPLPSPADPLFTDYIEGLRQHLLVARKCTSCGLIQWPPRPLCTNCQRLSFEPTSVNGTGVVYTYTIVYRAFDHYFGASVPYGVVVVQLDAGIRMLGGWAGANVNDIACGVRVKAHFVDTADAETCLFWLPT